jgi:predicted CXXCH cytochrome family protein
MYQALDRFPVRSRFTRRHGVAGKCVLPSLVLLFVSASFPLRGQQASEHLFIEEKELKAETCLMCHTDKKQGKYVHAAIAMGCEACHQASSKDNKTTITLTAPAGDLCLACHQVAEEAVMHEPYKNHQCVVCHDPHSSNFVAHTREATNNLCFQCHLKRSVTGETLKLAGGIEVSAKEFEQAPKINLDGSQQAGHPWVGHPIGGRPDPVHPDEKISCLSCHRPHSSTQDNLIIDTKKGPSVCDQCHEAVEAQRAKENKEKFEKLHPNMQQQPPQKQQPEVPPNWRPPRGKR